MNEHGKRAVLQLVMILLLKANDEGAALGQHVAEWGANQVAARDSQTFKNPTRQVSNLESDEVKYEQNIYLRLVEPIAYVFVSKSYTPILRYLA